MSPILLTPHSVQALGPFPNITIVTIVTIVTMVSTMVISGVETLMV